MKKILLSMIAITGLALGSNAQNFGFMKGDGLLEGAIGVSSSDNQNTEKKVTSFSLSPKVGYFISDKTAIGVQFNYSQSKNTDYSGANETYNQVNGVGVGVFARYYFLEIGSRFKAYGEAGLGYRSTCGESNNGTTTVKFDKTNTIGINGGVGANFFLTDNIAIGYQFADVIGFSTSKANTSGTKAYNNFHVNLNSFNNFFNTGQFSLTFKL
ncbi:MAG: OmpW family outer membrane protein [Ginsengibacter sp.]